MLKMSLIRGEPKGECKYFVGIITIIIFVLLTAWRQAFFASNPYLFIDMNLLPETPLAGTGITENLMTRR